MTTLSMMDHKEQMIQGLPLLDFDHGSKDQMIRKPIIAYRPKGMERIDDEWVISYDEEYFDYKEPTVMVLKTDEVWDVNAHIEKGRDIYGGLVVITNTRATKAILY